MKTIYKYPLMIEDVVKITMPKDANIISVISDGYNAFLYAIVETKNPDQERVFEVYGTGNPLPGKLNARFMGTIQQFPFIWHVFESNEY